MQTLSRKNDSVTMVSLKGSILFLFMSVVTRGFPAAKSVTKLPSLLTIASEDELGRYSKKWNMTPVQMCTLMGHQMTIAQPLMDIGHPMVANLPSITDMAMSDAVMICEKVLNNEKGQVAGTITTVVEETRQEMVVEDTYRDMPTNFMSIDDMDEMMESALFTDREIADAMAENQEALVQILSEVTRGFPAAKSMTKLPSLLTIASEDELGRYSKKWKMTPVQMCTLMGHQMTIAQPLMDIGHPMVANLPSITDMAMSDAVTICEKVLNTGTITTVVEESRQEMVVEDTYRDMPTNFMSVDDMDEMMESALFTDREIADAMAENQEALVQILSELEDEEEVEAKTTEPPPPTPKPGPTIAEIVGRVVL